MRAYGRFVDGPERALPHGRGRRHHPGRHGPDPPRDRPRHRRQRVARRLGRPVAGHGVGRAVGHEGRRPSGCGARRRWPAGTSCVSGVGKVGARARRPPGRRGGASSRSPTCERASVDTVVERYGAADGRPPEAAHAVAVRHLLAVRARRRAQLHDHPRAALRGRRRRGQQPAGRRRRRRAPAAPGRALRPRLRGQRRRRHQHRRGARTATTASGPTTASARSTTPCAGCSTGPTPTASPPRRPPTASPRSASRRSAAPASSTRAPTGPPADRGRGPRAAGRPESVQSSQTRASRPGDGR